jgi:predicted dehydrogenase
MRIAVMGAGLIGRERLLGIKQLRARGRDISVCGVCDPYADTAKLDVPSLSTVDQVYAATPDWVIIATPHDSAVELAIRSLRLGFKVLLEKPLGRSIEEARRVVAAASRPDQLSVGFNYRFYKGIAALIEDVRQGTFGPLVSVNITLGHGCNPDITQGWKLDPVRAGGGALLDPGVHLLDLCRLLAAADKSPQRVGIRDLPSRDLLSANLPSGDLPNRDRWQQASSPEGLVRRQVEASHLPLAEGAVPPATQLSVRSAWAWNGFWKTGVEEEVRIHLDAGSYLMDLDISIVRWRSIFQMEVHGRDGYGIVTGRNRSYGKQRYIRGKRWGWQSGMSQSESEELVLESNGEEVFADEMDALFFGAGNSSLPPCSSQDALAVMELLEECRAPIAKTARDGDAGGKPLKEEKVRPTSARPVEAAQGATLA